MSRWVGFIDLLALRHAASIDQGAVEHLLSSFFEVVNTFAHRFSRDDLTVDILSDSAIIRASSLSVMRRYYLFIRPELILKDTYFRLGLCPGDVDVKRYSLSSDKNVAGTYFSGEPGMTAYAAQTALNGVGASIFRPDRDWVLRLDVPDAAADLEAGIEDRTVVRSLYIGRESRPAIVSFYDFAMSNQEIGPLLRSPDMDELDPPSGDEVNSGFLFFDELYSKFKYMKSLDRYVARKYLSAFFTLIQSMDFASSNISEDGSVYENLPAGFARLFLEGRHLRSDRDDDFWMIYLFGLNRLLTSKMRGKSLSEGIDALLETAPELKWACSFLGRRRTLYKRMGAADTRIMSMRVKEAIARGMNHLGYWEHAV